MLSVVECLFAVFFYYLLVLFAFTCVESYQFSNLGFWLPLKKLRRENFNQNKIKKKKKNQIREIASVTQ